MGVLSQALFIEKLIHFTSKMFSASTTMLLIVFFCMLQ